MRSNNPENKIIKAMQVVESNKDSSIRINANGGNSILIVCEPTYEFDYIISIKKLMGEDKYEIIDLSNLLCEFVNENKSDLENGFELLKGSIHQIFKIPDGEEGKDLLSLILNEIDKSIKANKIPVLINTGSLYGSRIENINIMENDLVMKAKLPLIILYPAIWDKDRLLFLGNRPASKYRCLIID